MAGNGIDCWRELVIRHAQEENDLHHNWLLLSKATFILNAQHPE